MELKERNELIVNYLPLANKLAWNKSRVTPNSVTIDELKSAAYMGLVDAAQKFKEDQGSFGSYARFRVMGEIQDYLRSLGWINKSSHIPVASLDAPISDEFKLSDLVADQISPDSDEFFDEAGKHLTDLGRDILKLYYIRGMSLKKIGIRIGVGESRVSQLLKGYRESIKENWEEMDLKEIAA